MIWILLLSLVLNAISASGQVLSRVSGCFDIGALGTVHCPRKVPVILTVYGQGFGQSQADVYVDGERCLETRQAAGFEEERLLCLDPPVPTTQGAENAKLLPVSVQLQDGRNLSLESGGVAFSVAPVFSAVSGCQDGSSSTMSCPTDGRAVLTIRGANFVSSLGVAVFVGGTRCHSVQVMNETMLLASGCAGQGLLQELELQFGPDRYSVQETMTVSYTPIPTVDAIFGCLSKDSGSVLGCRPEGDDILTFMGNYFDADATEVFIGGLQCADVQVSTPQMLTCQGYPGFGNHKQVLVISAGESSSSNLTLSYALPCPHPECSGHGQCDTDAGICYCDTCNGLWGGRSCADCLQGWYGASCLFPCPGGADPCSGHGTCDDGISGTGLCACEEAYFGPACTETCAAVDGVPCAGHGTCAYDGVAGVCSCYSGEDAGFWAGDSCGACQVGFLGPECKLQCPSCSGHGACEVSGTIPEAKCVCSVGYFGSSCAELCPTADGNLVCNAHGSCTSEGQCICDSSLETGYWDGPTCSVCLPGYTGPQCKVACPRNALTQEVCSGRGTCSAAGNCVCVDSCGSACETLGAECPSCPPNKAGPTCADCPGVREDNGETSTQEACSGHGSCGVGADGTTTTCFCEEGYAGETCALECPSGQKGLCSRQGWCNQGSTGDGTCECFPGYVGSDCSVTCPSESGIPCSGHGQCELVRAKTGACQCQGQWGGTTCSECQSGFYGLACDLECPKEGNLLCSGHGTCGASGCICKQDQSSGFWEGPSCSTCQAGYWGSSCLGTCPGPLCSPCFGHGVCDENVDGTGVCSCNTSSATGFWAGEECTLCVPGYFGSECKGICPGGPSNPCNGHGLCSDGKNGDGLCTCFTSAIVGMWTGPACNVCAKGSYGPSCQGTCPGTFGTVVCSGNGLCNDGLDGDGLCQCYPNYAGLACETSCPLGPSNGLPCNAVGTCDSGSTGTGLCTCPDSDELGHFTGSACQSCMSGWAGQTCIVPCPGMPSNICNGRGVCDDDLTGTGACTCSLGWSGTACEVPCLPTHNPCNGHGTCTDSGSCYCFQVAEQGFWSGALCDACSEGWTGPNCAFPCPLATSTGLVCNGAGTCLAGLTAAFCICPEGTCGPSCENVECEDVTCPPGKWGIQCQEKCVGYQDDTQLFCGGHGQCHSSRDAIDGSCSCSESYVGEDCSQVCPGNFENGIFIACSGFGDCVPGNDGQAVCNCIPGYLDFDCSKTCPTDTFGVVCAGHGQCSDIGECSCETGYTGQDCAATCPGGLDNICSGHGICRPQAPYCECTVSSLVPGNWSGIDCSSCAPSWHGPQCDQQCFNGITNHRTCVCNEYWAMPNCDKQCPGLDGNGTVCSGHGLCHQGNAGNGTCTCDADYYGLDCSVYCKATECKFGNDFVNPLSHAACSSQGECICANSVEDGFWTGDECDVCAFGFRGTECKVPCPCFGHGHCDVTGTVCTCSADATLGFWSGRYCSTCLDGYIGAECTLLDIAISRASNVAANETAIAVADADRSTLVLDQTQPIMYVGGSPVVAINTSSDTVLAQQDLGGILHYGIANANGTSLIIQDSQDPTVWKIVPVMGVSSGEILTGTQECFIQSQKSKCTSSGTSLVTTKRGAMPQALTDTSQNVRVYKSNNLLCILETSLGDTFLTIIDQFSVGSPNTLSLNDFVDRISYARLLQASTELLIAGSIVDPLSGLRYWQVLLVKISGEADLSPTSLNSVDQPITCADIVILNCGTQCSKQCEAVAVQLYGGFFYLAVHGWAEGLHSLTLVKIRQSTREVVGKSLVMGSSLNKVEIQASAIEMDAFANAGYIAVHEIGHPSVLFRFSLSDVKVAGTHRFEQVASEVELIIALVPDFERRLMYCLLGLQQMRVAVVNLYSLSDMAPFNPEVAATDGGTEIAILVEGLKPDGPAFCQFGTTVVSGTVNGSHILCSAPSDSEGSGQSSCAGQTVEVSLEGNRFTKNKRSVRRLLSPTIEEVLPTKARVEGGQLITIRGFGFRQTDYLKCRFGTDPANNNQSDPASAFIMTTNITFINSFEVRCQQPARPLASTIPSYIEVSLDGQIYSSSGLEYDMIGDPHSIQSESTMRQHVAAKVTFLDKVDVLMLDSAGHKVGSIQRPGSSSYEVSVVILSAPPGRTIALGGNLSALSIDGVATFEDLYIEFPLSGPYTLRFTTPEQWAWDVHLTIVQGKPHSMMIAVQPSEVSYNDKNTVLERQPRIRLLDSALNHIINPATGQAPVVEARFVPPGLEGSSQISQVSIQKGEYSFEGVKLIGVHDVTYHLIFSIADSPIPSVISSAIVIGNCSGGPADFAIANESTCLPCPLGAGCSGSSHIVAQENYWRASGASYTFYQCSDSNRPCSNGQCLPGFTGPKCAVCEPGYSGSQCGKCPDSNSDAWYWIALFLALTLLGLAGFVLMNISEESGEASSSSVLAKMLVNHLQVTTQTGAFIGAVPKLLQSFQQTSEQTSSVNLPFDEITCVLKDFSYYSGFLAYVFVPPVLLFIAICMPLCFWNFRRLAAKHKWLKVMFYKPHVEPKSYGDIYLLTATISMFVAYTTVITACGQMLSCEPIVIDETDRSNPVIVEVLTNYPTIQCNDNTEYDTYYSLAVLFLLFYGIGIPAGFIATVLKFRASEGGLFQKTEKEKVVFFFFMQGYHEDRWFWEAFQLLRKLILMLLTVFITETGWQAYMAIWFMSLVFLIHMIFQPFALPAHNNLETLSIGIILLNLNVGLLYYVPGFAYTADVSLTPKGIAITVIIFMSNTLVVGALLYNIVKDIGSLALNAVRSWRDRKQSEKALKSTMSRKDSLIMDDWERNPQWLKERSNTLTTKESGISFDLAENADKSKEGWYLEKKDPSSSKEVAERPTPPTSGFLSRVLSLREVIPNVNKDSTPAPVADAKDECKDEEADSKDNEKTRTRAESSSSHDTELLFAWDQPSQVDGSDPASRWAGVAPGPSAEDHMYAESSNPLKAPLSESSIPRPRSPKTSQRTGSGKHRHSEVGDILTGGVAYDACCAAANITPNPLVQKQLSGKAFSSGGKELSISSIELTASSIQPILGTLHLLPNLKSISLKHCGIDDECFEKIFQFVVGHPSLSTLILSGNRLTDDGAQRALKLIRKNNRICKVTLDENQIENLSLLAAIQATCNINSDLKPIQTPSNTSNLSENLLDVSDKSSIESGRLSMTGVQLESVFPNGDSKPDSGKGSGVSSASSSFKQAQRSTSASRKSSNAGPQKASYSGLERLIPVAGLSMNDGTRRASLSAHPEAERPRYILRSDAVASSPGGSSPRGPRSPVPKRLTSIHPLLNSSEVIMPLGQGSKSVNEGDRKRPMYSPVLPPRSLFLDEPWKSGYDASDSVASTQTSLQAIWNAAYISQAEERVADIVRAMELELGDGKFDSNSSAYTQFCRYHGQAASVEVLEHLQREPAFSLTSFAINSLEGPDVPSLLQVLALNASLGAITFSCDESDINLDWLTYFCVRHPELHSIEVLDCQPELLPNLMSCLLYIAQQNPRIHKVVVSETIPRTRVSKRLDVLLASCTENNAYFGGHDIPL